MPLEPAERTLFEQWSREDPPDAWEIERNDRIRAIQGTRPANPVLPLPRGGEALSQHAIAGPM